MSHSREDRPSARRTGRFPLVIHSTPDGLDIVQRAALEQRLPRVSLTSSPARATVFWHRHSLDDLTVYDRMPKLRHVHVDQAGLDGIPIPAGVTISTAHDAQTDGVAEWVILAIMWDAKRLADLQRLSDAGRWVHVDGIRSVRGRTLVSFGAGAILQKAAPALRALGVEIVATTRTLTPRDGIRIVPYREWLDYLPSADWLLVDAPLTTETRHALNGSVLSRLAGACLVNVARGEILAPGVVQRARRQGWLRSAVLDVHAVEPLPGDAYEWADPNVLVTPHTAWRRDDLESRRREDFFHALAQLGRQSP